MTRPRIVFFGTPSFAVLSLEAVAAVADVVAVVCQPDKPAGRGHSVAPPAVKLCAGRLNIPVEQPAKLKDGAVAAWLRGLCVDLGVVVAYGRILPPEVLAAPRLGCVNVHGSVLPRHRGAAPVQWAILSGDRETGVTLMRMDEGMDTGPMLSIRRTAIGADETSLELFERLSIMGAQMLRETLDHYLDGSLTPVAQDNSKATSAPMLTRELSPICWKSPAQTLHDRVRALAPWPGADTTLGARRLMVHQTRLDDPPTVLGGAPGEVVQVTRDRVWVASSDGLIALTKLQFEGKKALATREFLAGHPLRAGALLG